MFIGLAAIFLFRNNAPISRNIQDNPLPTSLSHYEVLPKDFQEAKQWNSKAAAIVSTRKVPKRENKRQRQGVAVVRGHFQSTYSSHCGEGNVWRSTPPEKVCTQQWHQNTYTTKATLISNANSDRMCLDGIQHRIMDNQHLCYSIELPHSKTLLYQVTCEKFCPSWLRFCISLTLSLAQLKRRS